MRKGVLGLLIVLLVGCSPSLKLGESQGVERTIYFDTEKPKLTSLFKWFGQDAINQIESENLITKTGEQLMQQILDGYKNQVLGIEQVYDKSQADIIVKVHSVEVKRGWFTMNFLFPGPMYKISTQIEVIEAGTIRGKKTYKMIENMAYVNFRETKKQKWMDREEKRNPEYQLATFKEAMRGMYEKFYFEYFGISLRT